MSSTRNGARRKVKRDERLQFEGPRLDRTEAAILRELAADARIPLAELARRVGLSAPSVADRVRRLEDVGIVAG